MSKKTILILADYYLPGYKGGGTLRTIVNMVERLHKSYKFKIITRDHDGPEDKTKYQNVKLNDWNKFNNADVYYISKENINLKKIRKLVYNADPDCLYVSSCFSTLTINVLLLKRLNKLGNIPLIIAPVGELVKGALSIKPFKKKSFLKFAKVLGLYSDVIWKASGIAEKENVEIIRKKGDAVFIAPDLSPNKIFPQYKQEDKPIKNKQSVNFVFLSRFDRKKNFKWFLENVKELKGKINIDIYAPIEDEIYWEECKEIISNLPSNFNVKFKGSLPYEMVVETLFKYHFFVLPTLGENFGHVFLEALSAGCPLLISDRNPWRNLKEKNIGWDLSLENPDIWREKVTECVEMEHNEFEIMSVAARGYAINWLSDDSQEKATRDVLEFALNKN